MAANINDKFAESTTNDRPNAATLTAQKTSGATSLTVDSTTGWPTATAVHFTMYEVDAEGVKDASTQRDYKGIVNSSTTINNLTVRGGADRTFPIGAKVICAPTAAWADDLVSGIVVSHNQDGTLKDDAVVTANITDANVTNAKLATGTGEPGGAWTDWTPTYSAGGSMTYTSVTTTYAKWKQVGKTVFFKIRASGTTGGTADSEISFTLPLARGDSAVTNIGAAYVVDVSVKGGVAFSTNTTHGTVRNYDSSNWGLGTSRQINVTGFYEVA